MNGLLANAFGLDGSQLAAEERQRLLSRLLARLAHEVRNPLSALDIHVQLLQEDLGGLTPVVPPRISDRMAIIRHELGRLDGIVRQFLTLAGPSAVCLQSVQIAGLLEEVRRLLGPEAAQRRIELVTFVPPDLTEGWADPGPLNQALVNLVINALQAAEVGGRVEVAAAAEAGGIRIDVSDTGPGVPAADRLAIFEPFYTTKPDGSGLGLWIVQQIAMAHGGTINVADRPGGGAVFSLRLPHRPSELP